MLPYPEVLPTSSITLSLQVCTPFTCGQFSEVSIFVCVPFLLGRAPPVQLWPPPSTYRYHPPEVRNSPRRGPIPDAPRIQLRSPNPVQPLPARSPNPSQLRPPHRGPFPPAVPPSRASSFPQMCTLPAPPYSPTRPEAVSTSHNAPRRGPRSRDAPRHLPPLFPPCLAQRLFPKVPFPLAVTPATCNHIHRARAKRGRGPFPSVLCGRARSTSPPSSEQPPHPRPGDYKSQRPPGGGADTRGPRPSARPRPWLPMSAREFRGANLGAQSSAPEFLV